MAGEIIRRGTRIVIKYSGDESSDLFLGGSENRAGRHTGEPSKPGERANQASRCEGTDVELRTPPSL